jgi:hypothetical protein
VVEELWNTQQVIQHLEITMNNLRQLQFRKTLKWVKKEGKAVFYRVEDVKELGEKRNARKTLK